MLSKRERKETVHGARGARNHLITRGRGYQFLEHPQIQGVLALPPTVSVTRMNTGEMVELFEGGWLALGEGLPSVRVIVARHLAPPPDKPVKVGKLVGEWVYELFLATVEAERFLSVDYPNSFVSCPPFSLRIPRRELILRE